jgi:hypothetical protein
MISNKPKFLTVVLPLATLMSVGIAQSASARQQVCGDVEKFESYYTGRTISRTSLRPEPCPGPGGMAMCDVPYDSSYPEIVPRKIGSVYECRSQGSVGAIFNVGNGSPGYGASLRFPLGAFALRGTYLFTENKTDRGTLALTREIDLGAADLFIGGGYNADKGATEKPTEENKRFNYPFATVGVDYRITPNLDLNLGIIIPVSGGSNATNYNIGIALNF